VRRAFEVAFGPESVDGWEVCGWSVAVCRRSDGTPVVSIVDRTSTAAVRYSEVWTMQQLEILVRWIVSCERVEKPPMGFVR
jgi:hypothetical protein